MLPQRPDIRPGLIPQNSTRSAGFTTSGTPPTGPVGDELIALIRCHRGSLASVRWRSVASVGTTPGAPVPSTPAPHAGHPSGPPSTEREVDSDRAAAFAVRVWGYKQGEVVSLMVHLGDRLGLYGAMVGQGPVTARGLADRTGLRERWLLEWLRGQAAAGLLESPTVTVSS